MPRPELSTRSARMLLPVLLCSAVLAGCGGSPPPRVASEAPPEAITRSGDVTIRASAVPTSVLGKAVARQYGIRSGEDTILLLVALRRGPDANETSVPAEVSVTVTDLSGQRQDVPMRELRSGQLLDYVGTVDISGPDTLRFDVRTVRENGETSTLQFAREFHPL